MNSEDFDELKDKLERLDSFVCNLQRQLYFLAACFVFVTGLVIALYIKN